MQLAFVISYIIRFGTDNLMVITEQIAFFYRFYETDSFKKCSEEGIFR